jgi:hypothetical protein
MAQSCTASGIIARALAGSFHKRFPGNSIAVEIPSLFPRPNHFILNRLRALLDVGLKNMTKVCHILSASGNTQQKADARQGLDGW